MPEYPKITSKTIDYPNAPSGKAVIGKYIPPFEENSTGFGFKGVVIEDAENGKLECAICGKWFEQLGMHIQWHGMNNAEYKRRFGLLQSTALKSHRMRLIQSEVMIKMRKAHPKHRMKFKKGNSYCSNRLGKPKAEESRNKYGVCDLQIMEKVIELAKELKKTPTLVDLKERYGAGFIFHLHKKYRSYIKYCHEIGMDAGYSNFNPKYSKEYFIEKALSNEANLRIFTVNESKALYKYIKGGIPELKEIVCEIQNNVRGNL
jgi:hypothetical protein